MSPNLEYYTLHEIHNLFFNVSSMNPFLATTRRSPKQWRKCQKRKSRDPRDTRYCEIEKRRKYPGKAVKRSSRRIAQHWAQRASRADWKTEVFRI